MYAGECERIHGEVLQPAVTNTRVLTFRQPVGVVEPSHHGLEGKRRGMDGVLEE